MQTETFGILGSSANYWS